MLGRLLACLVFALSIALSAGALAQDPKAEAARLKAEGDALMGEIKYEQALEKYEQAYKLHADPALLYNQGRALEALSRYPEALEKLKSFDATATPELHERVPNLDKLIKDIEGRTCLLSVEVAQKGALVRLGSTVLGTSPIPEKRVNAAKRVKIEVSLEGYDSDSREVELPGGGSQKVTFNLFPKDRTAILVVDSPVKGATITIDDMPPRQVPSEVRLPAGKHTVSLSAEGYEDNTIEVLLNPAERKQVVIEPGETPVYERWWFWTIWGGLLAAGGAAGITYAVLTEGSPDEGSIPPCQVKVSAEGDGECNPPSEQAFGPRRGARGLQGVSRGGFQIGPVPVVTVRF